MKISSGNFRCKSLQSDSYSGENPGDTASVECWSSYPTMISCGWRTNLPYPDAYNYNGAWIERQNGVDVCIAENGDGGYGVYARARCCDFTHLQDFDCITSEFGTVSGNGNTLQGECTGTYNHLTGCAVYDSENNQDGAYFGLLAPSLFLTLCFSSYNLQFLSINNNVHYLLYSQRGIHQYRL